MLLGWMVRSPKRNSDFENFDCVIKKDMRDMKCARLESYGWAVRTDCLIVVASSSGLLLL